MNLNYAIFRNEPIYTLNDLSQIGSHNKREKKAYNSNPNIKLGLTKDNIEIVPLKEIAKAFSISENHLSKVLQRLVKSGFLVSVKGPRGGFSIVQGKENSSLMDIYEAIEGKYIRKDCLFSSRHITSCCCIMKPLISSINNTFEEFMKNNSISNLKL